MNTFRTVTVCFAILLVVTLASSLPVAETNPLSPVQLANDQATTSKVEATTTTPEAITTEYREKREARRYDEEQSRRKFIASAAFAALG